VRGLRRGRHRSLTLTLSRRERGRKTHPREALSRLVRENDGIVLPPEIARTIVAISSPNMTQSSTRWWIIRKRSSVERWECLVPPADPAQGVPSKGEIADQRPRQIAGFVVEKHQNKQEIQRHGKEKQADGGLALAPE
jgi:hypothetical protein